MFDLDYALQMEYNCDIMSTLLKRRGISISGVQDKMNLLKSLVAIVDNATYKRLVFTSEHGLVELVKSEGFLGVGMYCYPLCCIDYVRQRADLESKSVVLITVSDKDLVNAHSLKVYSQLKLMLRDYPNGLSNCDLAEKYYDRYCEDASLVCGVSFEGDSPNTLMCLPQVVYCIRREKVVKSMTSLDMQDSDVIDDSITEIGIAEEKGVLNSLASHRGKRSVSDFVRDLLSRGSK